MPHQKKYQTSQTKSASIGENGLITIILPDLPVSGQLELLNKIKCTWPKLKVVFIGKDPGANDVISLFRGGLTDYLISPNNIEALIADLRGTANKQVDMQFNPLKFNLTEREFEVCRLLVRGLRSKCVFQPSVTAHSSNMTGHSK